MLSLSNPDVETGLSVVPLRGMPMFLPGMSVAAEVRVAAHRQGESLRRDDIVVVAQKIVSKAEGRLVRLGDVVPGPAAERLAEKTGRKAAFCQLIIDESVEVLRASPAAIIVRHSTGHVLANAGIDGSNVEDDAVLLWPRDGDVSARTIRMELGAPAVVIADSLGRAWLMGTLGTAIGCAGLAVIDDKRGKDRDLFGRTLQATIVAVADAIATAAVLTMGEGAEGTPAAIVRGAGRWVTAENGPGAASAVRPLAEDMFR